MSDFHCTRCGVTVSEPGRRCVDCSRDRHHAGGRWQDDAACATTDPEVFFPTGQGRDRTAAVDVAKAVCAECPVRAECLTWALDTGDAYAVLGGTTPEEREVIRNAQRRARDRARKRAAREAAA